MTHTTSQITATRPTAFLSWPMTIAHSYCSVLAPTLALCTLAILTISTNSCAMTRPQSPEITVFNDNVLKTMQASCCINGIVTYLEIYEDRDPVVGTYRLEDPIEAPAPDWRVVMRLQNALLAYAKQAGLNIEGAPQEEHTCQAAQQVPATPLNPHLPPDTPLIPPAHSSACCKKCVIL
jgi:hypothetical protein